MKQQPALLVGKSTAKRLLREIQPVRLITQDDANFLKDVLSIAASRLQAERSYLKKQEQSAYREADPADKTIGSALAFEDLNMIRDSLRRNRKLEKTVNRVIRNLKR